MQDEGLVLRDIHAATAPPWWPPAPGWWLVAAVVALVAALALAWWLHRRRHRQRIERLFDDAMRDAESPTRQVAAISELLRRAARRRDSRADTLRDDAWLRFLDADSQEAAVTDRDVDGDVDPDTRSKPKRKRKSTAQAALFQGETGQLLLEGGFRRELDADAVAALRDASRARFIEWMTAHR